MSSRRAYRRGITMAETIVSTLVIGFVLVGTLQIVGPMVQSTSVHADRLVAANLANELTEEIATKFYTDPEVDSGDLIGVDAAERAANRNDLDDVDDFNGWSANPPKLSNNQSIVLLGRWTRLVKVAHVLLADPTTESATNTGLKRVCVVVQKDGIELARVYSLHSSAADSIGFVVESGGG